MQVRSRLSPRVRPVVICPPEERIVDSSAQRESDINVIVARYKKTGVLPQSIRAALAQYMDTTQVPTFEQMQQRVMRAQELFDQLPATVRKQFDNDPGQFLQAAQTPEGRALLAKLGLGPDASPEAQPEPQGRGAGGTPASPEPKAPEEPKAAPKGSKPDKAGQE